MYSTEQSSVLTSLAREVLVEQKKLERARDHLFKVKFEVGMQKQVVQDHSRWLFDSQREAVDLLRNAATAPARPDALAAAKGCIEQMVDDYEKLGKEQASDAKLDRKLREVEDMVKRRDETFTQATQTMMEWIRRSLFQEDPDAGQLSDIASSAHSTARDDQCQFAPEEIQYLESRGRVNTMLGAVMDMEQAYSEDKLQRDLLIDQEHVLDVPDEEFERGYQERREVMGLELDEAIQEMEAALKACVDVGIDPERVVQESSNHDIAVSDPDGSGDEALSPPSDSGTGGRDGAPVEQTGVTPWRNGGVGTYRELHDVIESWKTEVQRGTEAVEEQRHDDSRLDSQPGQPDSQPGQALDSWMMPTSPRSPR